MIGLVCEVESLLPLEIDICSSEVKWKTYMVEKLNHNKALHLFSWKAFRKGHPADGYFELLHSMVNYAVGLPLALEILGSFLFGRSKAEWKDALDRLKYVPDQIFFEILQNKL